MRRANSGTPREEKLKFIVSPLGVTTGTKGAVNAIEIIKRIAMSEERPMNNGLSPFLLFFRGIVRINQRTFIKISKDNLYISLLFNSNYGLEGDCTWFNDIFHIYCSP